MKKILIIEDDPDLNRNIRDALMAEGMSVETVFDGQMAEKILQRKRFDCVVLDINLPGINGFDVCRTFRNYNSSTPVLMLTAFDDIEDKVQGYDCGADDYLTKPFYMRELLLRVEALLKRRKNDGGQADASKSIVAGDLVIYPAAKRVVRQGTEIQLTPREYQILLKLVESPGVIIPKKDLISEIWGSAFDANTNTIEVYINFLRKKIDKPFNKDSIRTRIGFGYYFDRQ